MENSGENKYIRSTSELEALLTEVFTLTAVKGFVFFSLIAIVLIFNKKKPV